jgi:hypothetical protein
MRILGIAALSAALGGCATGPDAFMPTSPERSEILAGDYQSLASCSYEAIEKTGETGLRKADLPASRTSKIVLDPSGVVYWELSFKEVDAKTTAVSFNPTRNMWGSDTGGAKRVWPAVLSCMVAQPAVQPPKVKKRKG